MAIDYCSNCEREFAKEVKQQDYGYCPYCGSELEEKEEKEQEE